MDAVSDFRPPQWFRKWVAAVVLCNIAMSILAIGSAFGCEGGGEELPPNLVFSKRPVRFANNEKLSVKVTNTGGFAAVSIFKISR